MGLDVYATIIVGAPREQIYQDDVKNSYDVVKTDKNGIEYTAEEQYPCFIFMGKMYRNDGDIELYDLLEENNFTKINEQIVGIEIVRTESHRDSDEGIIFKLEDISKKINDAMEKFKSFGIKANIYLIQEISC